jgi:peroxiredoxin Q/BCP
MTTLASLQIGDLVPDLTMTDDQGQQHALRALPSGAVIYFYPKDMTPGCTTEACDFQANIDRFKAEGYQIFGVSPDSAKSHLKFRNKHGLEFYLIADEDHSICKAFGVWREKKNYGKTYMGVVRSTFVIAPDHTIAAIYDNVRVTGHVAKVLHAISAG